MLASLGISQHQKWQLVFSYEAHVTILPANFGGIIRLWESYLVGGTEHD